MSSDELETAVRSFYSAWSSGDSEALLALWAMDDPASSYLPAASEQRLTGADAVGTYFKDRLSTFAVIKMQPRVLHVRHLQDDLGSAFVAVDWALKKTASSRAIGGSLRVSAVLRRSHGRWQFCHYAECPLAPLVELRRFYQQIAADGHEMLT